VAEVEVTGDAEVEVGVGDEVVIRLPENATTGYVWSVRSVGEGLEVLEDTMVPAGGLSEGGAPPGAGGERFVRVRATAPTRADVALQLARPWEDEPMQELRVTVVAGPPAAGAQTDGPG
jgi:inhibitor of cysteine peptidase